MKFRTAPLMAFLFFVGSVSAVTAQEQEKSQEPQKTADPVKGKLIIEPQTLKLKVGESANLKARVEDPEGNPVEVPVLFYSFARRAVKVDSNGKVSAIKPGRYTVMVRASSKKLKSRVTGRVVVEVARPPLKAIEFRNVPETLYAGTLTPIVAVVVDESGADRDDVAVNFSVSPDSAAEVDELGNLRVTKPATFELKAEAANLSKTLELSVEAHPVKAVELIADLRQARTGDVIQFRAILKGSAGERVKGPPVTYSCLAHPSDDRGPGAAATISPDGSFVAEQPGIYYIVATSGSVSEQLAIRIKQRNVRRGIELLGHAPVRDVHTSDLWVWEGTDGRDYAVTGTWGGKGEAIFWDVTEPKKMKKIDTVQVDARTVNDVKISEDGKVCVISREGASNRRNGIVILDVSNPSDVKTLSTFDDQLTGGVHNLFIHDGHVFAVNNSRRYDIINISDPKKPKRISRFELSTPGHSIHDVWVVDGIAYSSNWRDGVQLVDVGNGKYGGTLEKPVQFGNYTYPTGWNHAAFPYRSSTGKFYVIAGDEAFPRGLHVRNKPTIPDGWIHFIDFTDVKNPREVARYQIPEAGSHNIWVEDDLLYVAYYNAGLRVVDISGELKGDLFRQGREVGSFVPTDHEGVVPNAAMTWGPQTHKGNIFISDWNSGLWALRLR